MTNPVVLSATCQASTINVVFDQGLVAPTNQPGRGFTFTADGGAPVTPSGALITTTTVANDTVQLTGLGVINNTEAILVTFVPAGSLQNAGAQQATGFTNQVATNGSTHAKLFAAVLAQNGADNTVATLTWSLPVTATLLATGLTAIANGTQACTITSVVPGANARQMLVTFAQSYQYSDSLVLSYNQAVGTWTSGTLIQSFSRQLTNASKSGTPSGTFPLSALTLYPLTVTLGYVRGQVGLTLNPVDLVVVGEFGPYMVDFGGTFGISTANPLGLSIPQDLEAVRDGMLVYADFPAAGNPQLAQQAALDWERQMQGRIATALTAMRAQSVLVPLGTLTVGMV